MISAILLVFLLQLSIHLINTIGKQTINDFLWRIYTSLPGYKSSSNSELRQLRKEVARLNRELTATSAQDEFSKWAKLRRQHDKAKDKYESLSRQSQSEQATFNTILTAMRFMGTQGLQFVCNFWFAKEAMFWLPEGWVPGWVEWVLALPRAPTGGVSVNVWALACAGVVSLVSEGVVAVWSLRSGVVKEESSRKGEAIKLEGLSSKVMGSGGGKKKKEL